MKRLAIAFVVAIAGFGVLTQVAQQPATRHHIVLSSVGSTPLTIAEMTEAADVVALVRPTGMDRVHWNSAANSSWTPTDERLAMIYNDQQVEVVDLLRGRVGQSITIRNIGGLVGDTLMEMEGLEPLDPPSTYLVFLETVDTPTREGWESALSFISQGQGIFVSDGRGFVNDYGLSVTLEDLRSKQ